jgi:Txe/YoeB family toxin of toxin-antitoxin system
MPFCFLEPATKRSSTTCCATRPTVFKPEPLRHLLVGAWSRRISEEHRLVYLVDGEDLGILPARFHDK